MFEPINLEDIVAVACAFLTPVLIIFIVFRFIYKKNKFQYHLAELMVEKGMELPENFFEKKDQVDSSVKLLKYGLIFLAIGIGMSFPEKG